jgi:hypothetical protein
MAERQKARNQYSDKRPIRIEGDVAYVPLTMGYEATIDAADVPLIEAFSWCADIDRRADGTIKNVYAKCNVGGGIRKRRIMMHRLIFDGDGDKIIDHIDRNGLNNRKSNLRTATSSENQFNRGVGRNNKSGIKGVSFDKRSAKWSAQIHVQRRQYRLGLYGTIEEAAEAYASAAKSLHGQFINLSQSSALMGSEN